MTTQNWNEARGEITDYLFGITGGNWDMIFDDDTGESLNATLRGAGLEDWPYSNEEMDRWLEEYRAGTITVPVGR